MPEKFWSDDFDMDLLKVFPNVPEILGPMADIKLWTVGHRTYGRLNHPTVWNTHGAFAWLYKPNLRRDDRGWFCVDGCVSNEEEIECTWLELLRDQWPHSYGFVLRPLYETFPPPPVYDFDRIMYDLRAWQKYPDIQKSRDAGLRWIVRANRKLARQVPAVASNAVGKQEET